MTPSGESALLASDEWADEKLKHLGKKPILRYVRRQMKNGFWTMDRNLDRAIVSNLKKCKPYKNLSSLWDG